MSRPLLLLTASLFVACAVTPYKPYSGGVGYSEVGTAKNRYEVVYHGLTGMDEATAKNYAIVRAAEIAKEKKMPYFRIAGSRISETRELTRDPDLFPRSPWTASRREMTEWEWRREQELEDSRARMTVRETRAPVVRVIVDLVAEDCEACLSTDAKLKEAEEKGIFKK
jgi:hypothetical protein